MQTIEMDKPNVALTQIMQHTEKGYFLLPSELVEAKDLDLSALIQFCGTDSMEQQRRGTVYIYEHNCVKPVTHNTTLQCDKSLKFSLNF